MADSARGKPVVVPDIEPATLSPADAAKRAGCSRTTIRNAITDNELKAYRDNRNHWRIGVDDLDDWMAIRDSEPGNRPMAATGTQVPDTENLIKIATLEAELEAERQRVVERDERISELKADLSAERARLDGLLEEQRSRGFLALLLGRRSPKA